MPKNAVKRKRTSPVLSLSSADLHVSPATQKLAVNCSRECLTPVRKSNRMIKVKKLQEFDYE